MKLKLYFIAVILVLFSCTKEVPKLSFQEEEVVYKQISFKNYSKQKDIFNQFKDSINSFRKVSNWGGTPIKFDNFLLLNKQKNKFVTVIFLLNQDSESFDLIMTYLGRKIKGRWYFFNKGTQPIYKPKSGKSNSYKTLRKTAYKLVLGGYAKYNFENQKWEYNPEFFKYHFNFGVKCIKKSLDICDSRKYIQNIYNPELSDQEIVKKNKYQNSEYSKTYYKRLKGSGFTSEQINEEYFYYKAMYNHYHNHGGDNTGIPTREVFKISDYKITYNKSIQKIKLVLPVKRWHNDYPIGQYSCFNYWVDSVYQCESDMWKNNALNYIKYNDSVIVNYIPNVKPNSLFKFRMFIDVFGYQDDMYFAFKVKNGKPIYQGLEYPDSVRTKKKFTYIPPKKLPESSFLKIQIFKQNKF